MRFFYLLIFTVINFAANAALAQVETTISYQYYPVKPKVGQSIYKQMFKDSTITHKSRKVVAITDWDIQYTCSYKYFDAEACKIDEYDVRSICKITLPKLITDEKKLNEAFNEYIPYLRNHELHHCQIATNYANHLYNQLKSMGPMECQALKTAVKKIRNQTINEAKKAHRLFDQQTLENRKTFHPAKHFLENMFPESPNDLRQTDNRPVDKF